MTCRYVILDATLADMRVMARTMRAEDRAEIAGMGQSPRHVLYALFRNSPVKRAAFVDGELAAVLGVEGMLAEDIGLAWAFTAPPVERLPFDFFREARRQCADMLRTRRMIATTVLASYERSIRFFRMVGFTIGPPVVLGPYGLAYRTMTMERG